MKASWVGLLFGTLGRDTRQLLRVRILLFENLGRETGPFLCARLLPLDTRGRQSRHLLRDRKLHLVALVRRAGESAVEREVAGLRGTARPS